MRSAHVRTTDRYQQDDEPAVGADGSVLPRNSDGSVARNPGDADASDANASASEAERNASDADAEASASDADPDADACGGEANANAGEDAAAALPDAQQPAAERPRGEHMFRFRADRFICFEEDVKRLEGPREWLSGMGLAVFLEHELIAAQVRGVDLVHPEVLLGAREWQKAVARGDEDGAARSKKVIWRHLEEVCGSVRAPLC